ncbi:MAG: hypothetical protein NC206_04910, partial [Bacteroides sp.]|nr:hypothetical protein [Roseburia sp.]MCM1346405.1 hypothetical protein [Bacteroides sp.]MCM1420952.1 hypothetical protein [Bacteroides sp.]
MKRKVFKISALSMIFGLGCMQAFSLTPNPDTGEQVVVRLGMLRSAALSKEASLQTPVMDLNGTGKSETLTVVATGLEQDVTLTVTTGFTVSPSVIKAGTEKTVVTVTNVSNLANVTGQLILRSGDVRSYVNLVGKGTPLAVKDLSQNPVYAGGTDEDMSFDGFSPSESGYTFEVRAKVDDASMQLLPFAVTKDGEGLKSYITSSSLGMYNGTGKKDGISNPSNGGTFYNTDGLYHTYRYAVAADGHIFIYRDGIAVDTLRTSDYALQPEWAVENGDIEENLIKNPGFEGEWNFNSKRNITDRIEGWDVSPYDQYNSTQQIVNEERSNEVDQNNHVLQVNRYMWSDGWGAAEISQIVDVAPNEIYSFSALAKGGIKSDGTVLGSLRIYDLQNDDNKVTIPVTSDSYQKYAADFETTATTKQIRVVCYLERDKWGASITGLKVDDVKLTGVRRLTEDKIGFQNEGADIAYFSFDNTGAYAPATAVLSASVDSLTIDGTNSTAVFTVNNANLSNDIQVSATNGFEVTPSVIKAGEQNVEVTVKNLTSLAHNSGQVILRSGDVRSYVNLVGKGT